MAVETRTENSSKPSLTPERAVRWGHLVITLPAAVIMIFMPLLGNALGGPGWGMFCFFLGFTLAWVWWSISVPRWREWARRHGADEKRTESLAEQGRCPLVWPKGSILEKTEFRPRKKT